MSRFLSADTVLCALLAATLLSSTSIAQDPTQGYAIVSADGGGVPVASALFSLRRSGVLISEAAIEGSAPIRAGRIFVDPEFLTGLAMANSWDQSVSVRLTLRDEGGNILGSPKTLDLEARGQTARFVADLFPESPLSNPGSITFEVITPLSPGLGAVTIRQGTNLNGEPLFATLPVAPLELGDAPGGGTAVFAGVGSRAPEGLTGNLVFPHLGAGGGLTTQILLISRSTAETTAVIRLFGQDGQPLTLALDGVEGNTFEIPLAGAGVFQGLLTTSGVTRQGYAVVSYTGPAPAGTAVFQFRDSAGRLISEAGVGARPATHRFRVFVDSIGTNTGLAVANPGNGPVDLALALKGREGQLVDVRTLQVDAAGQTAAFAGELFPQMPLNFTGQIEVISDGPVVPICLKLTQNLLGHPILTTLPVSDLDRPPSAGPTLLAHLGFGFSGGFELATRVILISNHLEADLVGSVSFIGMDGNPLIVPLAGSLVGSAPYVLPAGGIRQFRPGDSSPAEQVLFAGLPSDSEATVNLGSALQLEPLVLDESGRLRDDFQVLFAINDPGVATVSDAGRIEGVGVGFATLTAQSGDAISALSVTVPESLSGAPGFQVTGLVSDSRQRLFLTASDRNTILSTDGVLEDPELYAGVDQQAGFRDDLRLSALFKAPGYLALNQAQGTLYVSDTLNHRIREVAPGKDGRVELLAGGDLPGAADGPALAARFNEPKGIVLDPRGDLWVADSANHTIRRIDVVGRRVETIAGLAGVPGSADGEGENARFNSPTGLALEPEPLALRLMREAKGEPAPPVTILVADSGNGVIRKVTEGGRVETVSFSVGAAPAAADGSRDFILPSGIAADDLGNVFISDTESGAVLVLLRTGELVPAAQAGTFSNPRGLALTGVGTLTVADGNRLGRQLQFGSPVIQGFSPARIPAGSQEEITILGRNFAPETVLVAGGRLVEDVEVVDSRTIRFTAPNLPSGRNTVSLQHRGGLVQESLVVEAFPLAGLGPGSITTVAGGSSFRGDGGPATSASFNLAAGLDVGSDGAIVVADRNNHRIRRIDGQTGIISTVAGSGLFEGGELGDGGPALAASLFFPEDVKVSARGDLIIADTFNDRIRKVDPVTGIITTVAGSGVRGFGGDGGPAPLASIDTPEGVAVDRSGNVFISDSLNHRVRVVDAESAIIRTVAGIGEAGYSGDGGPAVQARLNRPKGLAVSPAGFLLIADPENHRVRQVDLATGLIQTVAGNGAGGFSGDGGPASGASLRNPLGIAFDLDGNIVIADSGNFRVRVVDSKDHIISTVAGIGPPGRFSGDGGDALLAELNFPYAVALNGAGGLLISDTFNHRIRHVDPETRIIGTIAGSEISAALGDDGPAAEASLAAPYGAAVTSEDFLLVLDTFHERLRLVDLQNGQISSLASLPGNFTGLAVDRVDDIFLSDSLGHYVSLITPSLEVIRVAGQPSSPGFSGDNGPATSARLHSPAGLATDADLNLYIADRGNQRVRRVNVSNRVIFTVAGNGVRGFSGDGGPANLAALNEPVAVALDGDGNLYVSDRGNHRVRLVDPAGIIKTVVGTGVPGYSGDGGPADQAQLFRPRGLAIDGQNNLFIADEYNDRVRRVDASTGQITTVAGVGVPGFSGDGEAATAAQLFGPAGLAFDSLENLFIADLINNRIRAVRAPLTPGGSGELNPSISSERAPVWLWSRP